MKKLVLIIGLIISCFGLVAQNDWHLVNAGILEELNCVTFTPAGYLFIGSHTGNIYRGDTSLNFNSVTPTIGDGVADIVFLDAGNGWAVGDDGLILSTTDSGNTWTPVISGTGSNLESIFFVDADTAFIAGRDGTILKSVNGGMSWTSQTSGTTNRLESVAFISGKRGFVAGRDGSFLETSNGGASWSNVSLGSGDNKEVFFMNSTTGFVAGENGIHKTTDGGANWNQVTTAGGIEINSLHFAGTTKGYAVGEGGRIFISTDGGDTWMLDTVFASMSLLEFSDVWMIDSENSIAVGEAGKIAVQFQGAPSTVQIREETVWDLVMYPNPATTYIDLGLTNKGFQTDVTIYTLDGIVVLKEHLEGTLRLYLKGIEPGMYLVTAKQEETLLLRGTLMIR